MAHLVSHVVDGVEVTHRRRDARAAAGLVRAADDAEVRDAAAGLAEGEVADVVVRGADDLADHEAGARRAGAAGDLRLREARGRAAGAVRCGGGAPVVEVEEVVVRDQGHPDRQVVFVDLVDPVDQRDLGRGHVRRPAHVGGVARVGDQREPVGAEDVAGRRILRRVVGPTRPGSSPRPRRPGRRGDDVRVEVAVGVGDEVGVEVPVRVGLGSHVPGREVLLGVGDRDRDGRAVAEAVAVERDVVGGVVVAVVDRQLRRPARHARRTGCRCRGTARP